MLVASLLDVVRDQQHVGATSPTPVTTQALEHPAQVRRAGNRPAGPPPRPSLELDLPRNRGGISYKE